MTKVAYNDCYGGFSLSEEAVQLARKISGDQRWGNIPFVGESCSDGSLCNHFYGDCHEVLRTDPVLIEVIETLGKRASGWLAKLAVKDVPKGARYRIDEYDGNESVMTTEDYEWSIAE